MQQALDASGCEVVTVAVRRERLVNEQGESLLDFIDTGRYTILPNTAGCFDADDAVRVARLGRELLDQLDNPGKDWVKLEVLGDKKTLLPDPVGTIEATKTLVADGFKVLVYTSDDPISAQRIKDAGAAAVMPAGSPIGSGQGVLNRNNIVLCLELLKGRRRLPGDRRRGGGLRERCVARDGARRRRRAAQHRDRPRRAAGDDGPRDAQGVRGGAAELPVGADRQEALRDRVEPDGGGDLLHPGRVSPAVTDPRAPGTASSREHG
jgi:hypothetical protein